MLTTFQFLFSNSGSFISDFKLVFTKQSPKQASQQASNDKAWECKLEFWCLNPACSFSELAKKVVFRDSL
jgi:hypothetical protein